MEAIRLADQAWIDWRAHGGGRAQGLAYPRTYGDLQLYARRHPASEARAALGRVEVLVAECGWRTVKQLGGADLRTFYSAAAEVFHEIASAIMELDLQPLDRHTLIGRREFKFPVEDIVLNLLHRANPDYRIVLVCGNRTVVRDGCGVYVDRAEQFSKSWSQTGRTGFAASHAPGYWEATYGASAAAKTTSALTNSGGSDRSN